MQKIEYTTISPDDGMVLYNGKTFCNKVHNQIIDNDEWKEVTTDFMNTVIEKERIEREEKMRVKHYEQERKDELERNRLHFPNGEFIELTK